MRRYELKSTMMTSNRPLEDWGKLIGDVPAATAILDRFLHHAELINITGKSYRMRDRKTHAPPAERQEASRPSGQRAKQTPHERLAGERGFRRHGRQKNSPQNKKRPKHCRPRALRGRFSRLAWLSLVGLHPCRAQLRFARQSTVYLNCRS